MTNAMVKRFRRLGPLVLCALVLAQVAITLHKLTHSDALQEARCALCVSASHASGPPPVGLSLAVSTAGHEPVAFTAPRLNPTSVVSPYESRAPPKSS